MRDEHGWERHISCSLGARTNKSQVSHYSVIREWMYVGETRKCMSNAFDLPFSFPFSLHSFIHSINTQSQSLRDSTDRHNVQSEAMEREKIDRKTKSRRMANNAWRLTTNNFCASQRYASYCRLRVDSVTIIAKLMDKNYTVWCIRAWKRIRFSLSRALFDLCEILQFVD